MKTFLKCWFEETYSSLTLIKISTYHILNKFKNSNLVITNNSSPSVGVLQRTNVIYQFKHPLGDCISENKNIYVGLTATTLSIGLVSRVFANGPGDRGSIPGRVTPKTLKMVLDTSLFNTQQYTVRIKGKVGNPGKEVAPSPTSRCGSYRKENHPHVRFSWRAYIVFWSCNLIKSHSIFVTYLRNG